MTYSVRFQTHGATARYLRDAVVLEVAAARASVSWRRRAFVIPSSVRRADTGRRADKDSLSSSDPS